MNQQAYKFLLSRASRFMPVKTKSIEPPRVRSARKIIKQYEEDQRALFDGRLKRMETERIRVKEIIHGGNYVDALKAVKDFEKLNF